MKALTVQEASPILSDLVRRAAEGETVTINDGPCTVSLQPVSAQSPTRRSEREALRQLQSQSQLTTSRAEGYLQEVYAERAAHGNDRH